MSSIPKDAAASHGNSLALTCLVDVIDASRWPRKALADEIGKSEQGFSKMTAGTQAFGMDDFGNLPMDLQVSWVKRYGKALGLEVRELSAADLAEEFLELVDRMSSVARLYRIAKPQPVKAGLGTERKEKAG